MLVQYIAGNVSIVSISTVSDFRILVLLFLITLSFALLFCEKELTWFYSVSPCIFFLVLRRRGEESTKDSSRKTQRNKNIIDNKTTTKLRSS